MKTPRIAHVECKSPELLRWLKHLVARSELTSGARLVGGDMPASFYVLNEHRWKYCLHAAEGTEVQP